MTKFNVQDHIEKIKKKLSKKISDGNISGDGVHSDKIISFLSDAMATEYICSFRYMEHYYRAQSLGFIEGAREFITHSNQEREHAEKIGNRIQQLGGIPEMDPQQMIAKSHITYKKCDTLKEMLEENLFTEMVSVEVYRQLIKYIGDNDPATRRILEDILLVEEEHVDDVLTLKSNLKLAT